MIRIDNKRDCCGCGACEQICPKHCISLIEDSQGFLYPEADASICVDCGLCERVCPAVKPAETFITNKLGGQSNVSEPMDAVAFNKLGGQSNVSEPIDAVTSNKLVGHPNVSEPIDAVTFNKLGEQPEVSGPMEVFAAKNPDASVRKGSSSGGVFSMLAESVLEHGGVVFGAMFNDSCEVVHGYVETKDQLIRLRGSKYVQSRIGNSFREVDHFLKEGRTVLFSGTPCQVAGLRNFLKISCANAHNCLDNLLLVDIVCHGVPSPMIWRDYLSSARGMVKSGTNTNFKSNSNNNSIVNTRHKSQFEDASEIPEGISVNFRDKSHGWRNYRVVIDGKSELYAFNPFMAGFLQNYYLRPSCYSCPIKACSICHSKCRDVPTVFASDITLGDYWGIEAAHPEFFDDMGVSLVIVHTSKGAEAMSRLAVDSLKSDFASAVKKNPSIVSNPEIPARYDDFWTAYKKEGVAAIGKFATTPSKTHILKSRFRCLIRRLLN